VILQVKFSVGCNHTRQISTASGVEINEFHFEDESFFKTFVKEVMALTDADIVPGRFFTYKLYGHALMPTRERKNFTLNK
jgi:hypothetical protein